MHASHLKIIASITHWIPNLAIFNTSIKRSGSWRKRKKKISMKINDPLNSHSHLNKKKNETWEFLDDDEFDKPHFFYWHRHSIFFFCCRVEKYKSQKNEKTLTTKMWVTQHQLKNDLHTLLCIIKKVDG